MTAIESKEKYLLAIDTRDLRKRYGEVRAVDGQSFAVRRGEIFVLLGVSSAAISWQRGVNLHGSH